MMQKEESIDTYNEKLTWFKDNEKLEVLLLIESSPWLIKMVVAWMNIATRKKNEISSPSGDSEALVWRWLWENTDYSQAELKSLGNFSGIDFEKALSTLIGNRIIYPDGSIHSFVKRYLREKVVHLFEPKAQQPKKNQ